MRRIAELYGRSLGLAVLFVLAACAQLTTSPAQVPTTPAPTLTASVAAPTVMPATATPSATWLPQHTATPTPWPSATPPVWPPTLTPATPGTGEYHLRPWTADDADDLITLTRSWLASIEHNPEYACVYCNLGYLEEYAAAPLAESEALLRFPNAPAAVHWRWQLAHDAAFMANGDLSGITPYGELMAEALNAGRIVPEVIPEWFASFESDIALTVTELPPPRGYDSSFVVEAVYPNVYAAPLGAHWWIVEGNGHYEVNGLASALYYVRESAGSFDALDLTGDYFPEVLLTYYHDTCCGPAYYRTIFDVSHVPALPLDVLDVYGQPASINSFGWSSLTANPAQTIQPSFVFTETLGDPYTNWCRISAAHTFHWDGTVFVEQDTVYAVDPAGSEYDQPVCQVIDKEATSSDAVEAVAGMVGEREFIDQNPVTEAAKLDQIRFRLALFEASTGAFANARRLFQTVATSANITDELGYRAAAQAFLPLYTTDGDVFRACLAVRPCDWGAVLKALAAKQWAGGYPDSLDALEISGVPIVGAGRFDFSKAGSNEFWFLLQPQDSAPEFWVVARLARGAQALRVGTMPNRQPTLAIETTDTQHRVINLNSGTLFSVEHTRDNTAARVSVIPTDPGIVVPPPTPSPVQQAYEALASVESELLAGGDPQEALTDLAALESDLLAGCDTYGCDGYYYVLGLANELAGNEAQAVAAYLTLWRAYPDSAYTVLARGKLEAGP